jgi:glycosyltransferase involved in cell wall biosynthesis
VLLENFLIRRIDLLITVGEKLRRHFAERGAPRSVVVGNWKRLGDFARSEQQTHATRSQLGIPEGALVVVCITQLLKDRKIDELLAAVETCPGAYLILGGKGILEERVVEAAAMNPRILYVGFASGKQIADYTCAGDVVYYGFDPQNPNARFSAPNKLYEALAAGRPLITGDFGEIADVVREAGCGIVLTEYSVEEIRRALTVLSDSSVRDSMAASARRFGRASLNWEKGERTLHREYSRFVTGLEEPSSDLPAEASPTMEVAK